MIQYTHTKNMYVFPSDLARFSMIVVYSVDLWMRVYCRHRRLLILVAVSWILNRVLCVCWVIMYVRVCVYISVWTRPFFKIMIDDWIPKNVQTSSQNFFFSFINDKLANVFKFFFFFSHTHTNFPLLWTCEWGKQKKKFNNHHHHNCKWW